MTDTRNNGGPAFPQHDLSGYGIGPKMDGGRYMVDGMSLRDWIAGQVVASAMTNANGLGSMSAEERREIFRGVAIISYEVADAMLTARSPSSKEA